MPLAPSPGSPSCYVIGDVHGCATELRLLLELLPLTDECTILFVGDYIDRGPHSREVIETILDLRRRHRVITLEGNHEDLLQHFLAQPESLAGGMFIYNGGSSTLASYADEFGNYTIPEEHLSFLRTLQLQHETPEYYFVHAGVPEKPLEQITPSEHIEDILWSRTMTDSRYQWSKLIVHGHTPVLAPEISIQRINVDTGCVFGGALTAIELPSQRLFSMPRQTREPPRHLRDIRSRRQAIRFQGSIPVTIEVYRRPLHFLTVNYSEMGMLLRCLPGAHTKLRPRQAVRGSIGAHGPWRVEFVGEVVRCESNDNGTFYAVRIVSSSCD